MENVKLCQSCGLPFNEEHKHFIAKESDGSDSSYCTFCYKNGEFLNPEATIEDMIELVVPQLARKIGEEAARQELSSLLPTLERWKR